MSKKDAFKKNRVALQIDENWESIADEVAQERDKYRDELIKLKDISSAGDIAEVVPGRCRNWDYSDRSNFELGDIDDLAEDIKSNGQLQPAILRKINELDYDYEVIAGERRWRACLLAGINLKAVIVDKNDLDCLAIQTSENKKHGLSSYSLAKAYAKIIEKLNISQNELSKRLGIPKTSLSNIMAFNRVSNVIWEGVSDMSKVSPATAAFLAEFCENNPEKIDLLLSFSKQIREGLGADTLKKLIDKKLSNYKTNRNNTYVFSSEKGEPLFRISSTGRISFSNSVINKLDIDDIGNYIKEYLDQVINS